MEDRTIMKQPNYHDNEVFRCYVNLMTEPVPGIDNYHAVVQLATKFNLSEGEVAKKIAMCIRWELSSPYENGMLIRIR